MAALLSVSGGAAAQTVAPAPPTELDELNAPNTVPEVPETAEPVIEAEESSPETLAKAPEQAASIEHVDMVIEDVVTSVRTRQPAEGDREYNLTDIAEALRSRVELHDTLLGYHRFQDGALMSINMATGKVRSNKIVLGKLPGFEPRETADPWISLNAVTVMSGTHKSEDEKGRIVLTLDKRLRPQFGLELWVSGAPVDTFGNEPRTIGPILLVPLRPVVDALGHELREEAGIVTVRRQQDQAELSLELATGLVSVNTTPRGVTPDMQFAERDTLLLPFSAIETLTGTHVKLAPGTNRIEVTLDDRLVSSAQPSAMITDEVRNTKLTIEALGYEISDRGPLRVETTGYWKDYNFKAQVDSAGGLQDFASAQPAWASVDIASLQGWTATVGDYNSNYRELSGIGSNRIRGAAWRERRPSGTILAIAAGVPFAGSESESERVSTPVFEGFAAGGRLISDEKAYDVGVAAQVSADGETGVVVVGGQKDFNFENEDGSGLESAYISADIGAFTADGGGADIRARGSVNYSISENTGISASADYTGEKFSAGATDVNFAGVFNQQVGARTNLSLGARWRAGAPIGAFNRVAFSARGSVRHTGGATDTTASTLSANFNAQVGGEGPSIALNATQANTDTATGETSSTNLRARALQRFDWGDVTAIYARSDASDEDNATQQFVATAQIKPYVKKLDKGALIQIAPNATLNWDGKETRINAGASVLAESGSALGDRLRVQGRLSAFSNFASETENSQSTRFLGSLQARYRVTPNAELTAIYSDDFSGRTDFSIGLRGRINFNPPRRHTLPDEGKGIINGRLFLDRNRDGIRQDSEPGVPGVRIALTGTRLGLNTSRNGYFTIQNVNAGLYGVNVSKRTLPLGYLVPEDAQPRVTVSAGHRTEIEIPLVLSGQVRGTMFIDENASGDVDPGEQRLEGQWLKLIPEDGSAPLIIHSASFGQYGFENVAPGAYTLEATVSGQPVRQQVLVEEDNPFLIVPIPVPPDLAQSGAGLDLSGGVMGEP